MNYPQTAETTEPRRGIESIFRPAQSQELFEMLGRLSTIGEQQGVTLPVSPNGELSPRTILVRSQELRFKSHALRPVDVYEPLFTRSVIEDVPSLQQPVKSLVSSVEVRRSRRGDHYLSLHFGEKSSQKLADERVEIWRGLEARAHKKLGWKVFVPDMLAAIISNGVDPQIGEHMLAFMRNQLPFEVTLDPVHDPASK